jgi:hypothetical protein
MVKFKNILDEEFDGKSERDYIIEIVRKMPVCVNNFE